MHQLDLDAPRFRVDDSVELDGTDDNRTGLIDLKLQLAEIAHWPFTGLRDNRSFDDHGHDGRTSFVRGGRQVIEMIYLSDHSNWEQPPIGRK